MSDSFDIQTLRKFYQGFYITEPLGNNAFSYQKRKHKKIYVPPIIEGNPGDLAIGDEPAFSEINKGVEISPVGLKNFIYLGHQNKDVFIFDNHNHAFFFWVYAAKIGKIHLGSTLLHVDQHRDTREPTSYFAFPHNREVDLQSLFEYTNSELNVGNFIKPALAANIFSKLEIIDGRPAFERSFAEGFVLDIDMDIFSNDMAYIDDNYKIERIRDYLRSASLVTIATSPFFMDQIKAIRHIKTLLS